MNRYEHPLGYWCVRVAHLFRLRFEERTARLGLHSGAAAVLFRLHGDGPQSLSQLARALEHAHPTLVKQVAALVQAGYLARRNSARDGRVKLLALTAEGEILARKVTEIVHALNLEVMSGMGEMRSSQMISDLSDLHSQLQSMAKAQSRSKRNKLLREVA